MKDVFKPLEYLTIEQLDRIDPWTVKRLGGGCIFQQAYGINDGYAWKWVVAAGREWEDADDEEVTRQELADAIEECKERLTVKLPVRETVELAR